jgi:hypothetical protein
LLRDTDRKPSAAAEKLSVSPNFVVKTLADAARIIAREGRNPPPVQMKPEPRPAKPHAAPEVPPENAAPAQAAVNGESRAHMDRPAAHAPAPAHPVASLTGIERQLEELVIQLRHQNRNAEMHGDFPKSKFAALIVQFMAAAALFVGMSKVFTQKLSYATYADIEMAVLGNLQAIAWLLAAVVLQGLVIALLVHARQK